MRILITGASGMVGRNILEHHSIDEFEILAPSSKELNLLDFNAIQTYLNKHRPNMVIHAAGKVGGIQANIREPISFLMENLDIGRNVVWGAYQAKVKSLINLASSCIYPRNHNEPLREELVLRGELEPTNEGYALAKIVTARLCDSIVREDASFQYKTLIPCNLYGRYDKFDPIHSHLLPAIIYKLHQAKEAGCKNVEIWGDGLARREFMYASDLADAIVHSVKNFALLPGYMNIGIGSDHTINEYYQIAAEVIGYTGAFTHDLSKPVGMTRKLLSIERQSGWGWSAQIDLRAGIAETYNFYLKEFMK